jgi:hypothetical protein
MVVCNAFWSYKATFKKSKQKAKKGVGATGRADSFLNLILNDLTVGKGVMHLLIQRLW